MRYYFFITQKLQRGSEMKPTLRALPGQTFPDGTPVDTNKNVQAPKERGKYEKGNREDYPLGTVFCSTYLAEDNSKNVAFYTVFKDITAIPEFHPVLDTPAAYTSPSHRNEKMEAAYALFQAGIDPNAEPEDTGNKKGTESSSAVYTPADENGMARPADTNWKEKYQGQVEEESQMLVKWLRKLFSSKNVKLPNRMIIGPLQQTIDSLYSCGESIDSIASRSRFEAFLAEQKIDYNDFSILKDGPLKMYIQWIDAEHTARKQCTARERNYSNPEELNDAVVMITDAHESVTGMSSIPLPTDSEHFKKAFEAGWTLDDLLEPDNLKKASGVSDYAQQLSSGAIPLPQKFAANGASFIELLMAEKKNRKPRPSDGFHVDELTWKILVRNLYRKTNTMLVGPSGSGKTEIVKLLCEKTGTPFTLIQMGTITDPTEQLVGKMDIDSLTGGTVFDWAEFALAIQRPGVILLDEVNRIPKNGENMLFSCLDKTRELSASGSKSSDKRTIKVHPDCMFMATANIGDQFTGTKQIDEAFNTRFVSVELDYLTQAEEEKILIKREDISKEDATNIAFVANRIRQMARKGEIQTTISTRETLQCASLVHDGFSVLEAMQITFLPRFDAGYGNGDPHCERAQIKQVISQRFNTK